MKKTGLENRRIIINDLDGGFLADEKILGHNAIANTIQVQGSAYDWKSHTRLTILIFQGDQLLEFKGTTKKSTVSSNIEIGLYQGKRKEDRKQSRYKLCTLGEVKSIVVENQNVFLHQPIPAMVKNISTTGILIMALTNCFQDNSIFQLHVPADSHELAVECRVVRKREVTQQLSEYGCRFLKRIK